MVADKVKELEQENILLKAQVEELQNICGGKANMPKNCEYCNNFYAALYSKRKFICTNTLWLLRCGKQN